MVYGLGRMMTNGEWSDTVWGCMCVCVRGVKIVNTRCARQRIHNVTQKVKKTRRNWI